MRRRSLIKQVFGISPVIATSLTLAIIVVTSSIIVGWGVPMIDDKKAEAEFERALSESKVLNERLNDQTTLGSSVSGEVDLGENGVMKVDSSGNRMVYYYPTEDGYNFSVSDLDDEDNELKIDMHEGYCTKAVTHWDIDAFSDSDSGSGCDKPPVTTLYAEPNNDTMTATLHGQLNLGDGSDGVTDALFQYRVKGSAPWVNSSSANPLPSGSHVFSVLISGLTYDTYEFRALVINDCGVGYGGVEEFELTTPEDSPSVITKMPEVSGDNVTFEGRLLSLGSAPVVDVYFDYREKVPSSTIISTSPEEKSDTGNFTDWKDGFAAGVYECRAVADGYGIDEGIWREFSIGIPDDPDVTTIGSNEIPTGVDYNVDIEGYLSLGDDGSGGSMITDADVFFGYSTSCGSSGENGDSPDDYDTETSPVNKDSNCYFDYTINNVGYSTWYCFQAFATLPDGTTIAGGEIVDITPSDMYDPPSVQVDSDSVDVTRCCLPRDDSCGCGGGTSTEHNVTLYGKITDFGDESSLTVHFEYQSVVGSISGSTTPQSISSSVGTPYTYSKTVTIIDGCWPEDSREYTYTFYASAPGYDTYDSSGTFQVSTCCDICGNLNVETGSAYFARPTFTMNGELTAIPDNSEVQVYFHYKAIKTNGDTIDEGDSATRDFTDTGTFSISSSLNLGNAIVHYIYYYAVAECTQTCDSIEYGDQNSYDNTIVFSVVHTLSPTGAQGPDVTLQGSIYGSDGGWWPADLGFKVFKDNQDFYDDTVLHNVYYEDCDDSPLIFEKEFENLDPDGYTFYAYAIFSGDGYNGETESGNSKTFNVGDDSYPTIYTDQADAIGDTTANMYGHTGCGGDHTKVYYGIEYRLSGSGGTPTSLSGNGDSVSCYLGVDSWFLPGNSSDDEDEDNPDDLGLTPGTEYEYRATGELEDGTVLTPGSWNTFTTTGDPPGYWATTDSSTVNGLSVDLEGTINADNENCQTGFTIDPPVGGCFLAGTKISMADGSYKNIEEVQIDDMVRCYDEESGIVTNSRVSEVFYHPVEDADSFYLIINDELRLTSNHPVWVDGEWISAGMIKKGDMLRSVNDEKIVVESVEKVFEKVPVYNIEVEDYHNYFAENILVHNKETPQSVFQCGTYNDDQDHTITTNIQDLAEDTTYTYYAWIDPTTMGLPTVQADPLSFTTSTGCIDNDIDGWDNCNPGETGDDGKQIDCNDGDADRSPGLSEWCDYKDNDCDGSVDENPCSGTITCYKDNDGDGHGGSSTHQFCFDCGTYNGYNYVPSNDDCNDNDDDIFPGAPEICGNLIDENCNGNSDDCSGSCLCDDSCNSEPQADIDGPTEGDTGTTYTFDGSDSYDDGSIDVREWKKNLYGLWTSGGTSKSYSWNTGGNHVVKHRVTDNCGERDTYSHWIDIKGWLCFSPESLVSMADGSFKPIKEIQVGDIVKCYNPASGNIVNSRVSEVYYHPFSEVKDKSTYSYNLLVNDKLVVTPDHPGYINGEWIHFRKAEIGDILINDKGKPIEITSIEKVDLETDLYNLEVETYHNFFTEGILVHNGDPADECANPPSVETIDNATQDGYRAVLSGNLAYGGESYEIKVGFRYRPTFGEKQSSWSYTDNKTFLGSALDVDFTIKTPELSVGNYEFSAVAVGYNFDGSPTGCFDYGDTHYFDIKKDFDPLTVETINNAHQKESRAVLSGNLVNIGAASDYAKAGFRYRPYYSYETPGEKVWSLTTTQTITEDNQEFVIETPQLDPGEYEFSAVATGYDSDDQETGATDTGQIYYFTITDVTNSAPFTPSNPSPEDGESDVSLNPTLEVTVKDADGDLMDVSFFDASTHDLIGKDTNVQNKGRAKVTWNDLDYSGYYTWYAKAYDGKEYSSASPTWGFATRDEPELYNQKPTDQITLFTPRLEPPDSDPGIIYGHRPIDEPLDWNPFKGKTGDYSTNGSNTSTVRNFVVSASDHGKGVCVDLYNSSSSGDDVLFGRIWIFNQGRSELSVGGSDKKVVSEGGCVLSGSGSNWFLNRDPLFVSSDGSLDVVVSQFIPEGGVRQMASGDSCSFVARLTTSSVRDLRNLENGFLRIQVHGDDGLAAPVSDFLRKDSAFRWSGGELVCTDVLTDFSIHQSIFTVKLK